MRKLILTLLIISMQCVAADKIWLSGKLVEDKTSVEQKFSEGTTSDHKVSELTIEGGDKLYFARGVANFRWSKVPHVTENAPIQYRLEKDHLFVLDEQGKEIKLTLLKTRMKDPDPKP